MSKYQEFQRLFVSEGQQYRNDADHCFDTIDQLTREMIAFSGWYGDDVEYINLTPPVSASKPTTVLRFNRLGKNRERIREVSRQVNSWWSLGIRFRLKPHLSVMFQPQEVLFVLPLIVKKVGPGDREVVVKIEPQGTEYRSEDFNQLSRLVFDRIQTILQYGIQRLISKLEHPEVIQVLGFAIDTENMQALRLESPASQLNQH